jgi:GDP-L-fucose synthase
VALGAVRSAALKSQPRTIILASAACHLLEGEETGVYNLGFGEALSISDVTGALTRTVGYSYWVSWDRSKPNRTPRKLLNSWRLRARGWPLRISLEEDIKSTYGWFLEHRGKARILLSDARR